MVQPYSSAKGKIMYKKDEVLVLNSENNMLPFASAKYFQDVSINYYNPREMKPGNVIYYFAMISSHLKGQKIAPHPEDRTTDGRVPDYSKVKLIVLESISRIWDMMFEYLDIANTSKDKRVVYGDFQKECTGFLRKCSAMPIPKIYISHDDQTQDDKMQINRCAYVPGKKLAGKIESYVNVALFCLPDPYKTKAKERFRFLTSWYDNCIAKTPLGMYGDDQLFIENDVSLVIKRLHEMYGAEFGKFRFPDIFITGASGSGKSTSLRNLITEKSK